MASTDRNTSSVLTAQYSLQAHDIWRWVDDVADEAVGSFVSGLLQLDPLEFGRIRASLSDEDRRTALAYAQRSAFAALRREDPALVRNSVVAMSLVTEAAVGDERVIWTIAGLVCHAQRRIGSLDRAEIEGVLSGADHAVLAAFTYILDNGSDLLSDSGVREATTRAGLVLLQDERLRYEPSAELIDRAYDVAELLERDRYHVESIIVAEEFMVYAYNDHGDHVDRWAVEAAQRKIATVSVDSVIDDGPYQPLRVDLVEFASAADAALVAGASDRRDWPDEIQLAVAVGPICAVAGIHFRTGEEPFIETVDSLERFRNGLLAAIS